jgi:hypothetical protein
MSPPTRRRRTGITFYLSDEELCVLERLATARAIRPVHMARLIVLRALKEARFGELSLDEPPDDTELRALLARLAQ